MIEYTVCEKIDKEGEAYAKETEGKEETEK